MQLSLLQSKKRLKKLFSSVRIIVDTRRLDRNALSRQHLKGLQTKSTNCNIPVEKFLKQSPLTQMLLQESLTWKIYQKVHFSTEPSKKP